MNEKIKEIAEFDGWELKPIYPFGKPETNRWYHPYMNGVTYASFNQNNYEEFPYLTDLNALHRVALDVMDRLDAIKHIEYSYTYTQAILKSFRSRPINGEYTDLHDAVYDAIVYLKQHDLCQPK